jgi:SAM-dependent methyltransferase
MSLQEIYKRYSAPDRGGDKGTQHSYIDIYGKCIQPGHTEALLEIGVWAGHSLAMWQEYLPEALVVGFDIDLSRVQYDVGALQIDATDRLAVDRALGETTFDAIIDDGSHLVFDQIVSFDILFDRLKPGGNYFIEDVAGPDALRVLMEAISARTNEYTVYDLRGEKGRWDDILVVITR